MDDQQMPNDNFDDFSMGNSGDNIPIHDGTPASPVLPTSEQSNFDIVKDLFNLVSSYVGEVSGKVSYEASQQLQGLQQNVSQIYQEAVMQDHNNGEVSNELVNELLSSYDTAKETYNTSKSSVLPANTEQLEESISAFKESTGYSSQDHSTTSSEQPTLSSPQGNSFVDASVGALKDNVANARLEFQKAAEETAKRVRNEQTNSLSGSRYASQGAALYASQSRPSDGSSQVVEDSRFGSFKAGTQAAGTMRSQPSRNPGGRGVLHVDNSSQSAENGRFSAIKDASSSSIASTLKDGIETKKQEAVAAAEWKRQGSSYAGKGEELYMGQGGNPQMTSIIDGLEKRYANDPRYGEMPQELKDELMTSTPGEAMSVVKEYWKDKGASTLSPETEKVVRSGLNDALQGDRYKGRGEDMFTSPAKPKPQRSTSVETAGARGGGAVKSDAADARRAHIANVQKNGGTVKEATKQLDDLDKFLAGGSENKANWEKFVAAKKAEEKAATAPITNKPTGVSGSADSMERQISSALAGQSSYVQSQVRAEINKGNKSSINDLVNWFSTQEKNKTTLKNKPTGVSGSADSMERQISSALAGQSSFVQSKVRAEINKGNKSSVNDLVNWFNKVEANNKAASIPPVSRSINSQTSRSPVPSAIPTPSSSAPRRSGGSSSNSFM